MGNHPVTGVKSLRLTTSNMANYKSYAAPVTTHLDHCNPLYMELKSFCCSKAQQPIIWYSSMVAHCSTVGVSNIITATSCDVSGPFPPSLKQVGIPITTHLAHGPGVLTTLFYRVCIGFLLVLSCNLQCWC